MNSDQFKPVIYGHGGSLGTCNRCHNSISTHRIHEIRPNEAVDRLVMALSNSLFDLYISTTWKTHRLDRIIPELEKTGVMLGAIIATTDVGHHIKAVSLSRGNEIKQVFHYMSKQRLGKDVELLSQTIPINMHHDISGKLIPATIINADYNDDDPPIGFCAAPKLLDFIFSKNTKKSSYFIREINMAEIYFKVNSTKSKYSTGEHAKSCGTCKRILPIMLCDKYT